MSAGSGSSDHEESSKEQDGGSELIILKRAMNDFLEQGADEDIFMVHCDPKSGRIVLTEA